MTDTAQPLQQPVDLLIHGARAVVTMDDQRRVLPHGWLAVSDGLVTAVGDDTVRPPASRHSFDAEGSLVTPGLVNAHQHLYQNLTRAMGPELSSLTDWFWFYFSRWQHLDEEAVRTSTRLGLIELALSGCTTSADHLYIHQQPGWIDAQVAEARDLGLRFTAVRGSMTLGPDDGGICLPSMVEREDDVLADCERLVRAHHDPSFGSLTRIAIGPSTLMSSTLDAFRQSAELAAALEVRLHTHVADDPDEEAFVRERYGRRPLEVLDEVGWLQANTWCAHMVYPDAAEIRLLAERGVSVAHCPSAMVVDGGVPGGPAPVRELLDAGIAVGIGGDGATAADHQSVWFEMRLAFLLARLRNESPHGMSTYEALWMATRGSAAALGREGEIGVLSPGANADIAIWRMDTPGFAGALRDPVEAFVRCASPLLWASFVGGRAVVEDYRLVGVDVPAELARHERAARRMQESS